MKFTDYLQHNWKTSQLVVGLDPDPQRMPQNVNLKDFCKGIIDATADYVCAFKPQVAYFSSLGEENTLVQICDYIRNYYPHIPIILDAKRGDIGSTAKQYATEAFDRYLAHSVTVNPYMGFDSVEPYLQWADRGVIILCRTSNQGGSDLQFLTITHPNTQKQIPLYLYVAELVAQKWNTTGQCGLVVGATFPNEIAQVREQVGDQLPLLIPGIGAQGGDLQATVSAGKNKQNQGMLINSSRAIIYASSQADWQEAASKAARATQEAIQHALGE
ncbi:orotidine-5'-phosphate decarboxylase [Basilea psittacipulmonis]|uniref:Orotidine 5'-phosphate decarboxylase n=1 Tax=Basilea psittacipulmonis DSM 24701 TaxID=1072685 RepID=A0A077DG25_9BURK|nr:orotidine-5'-phosphate decarboxylase [Basilea psittacipulmonis]AIL32397.1 hypothetical protein IX83_02885 [Basilea psittacipulmonis DSM 24701]